MNRAPEETINRKSPSKYARTGWVGAVPTTGGTGTQRGPVRCRYGLHSGKGAGHVPRPHRAPSSSRTVARMGPVPFCPILPLQPLTNRYRPHTVFAPMFPRYRACTFWPVFDTYQPFLPMLFLPVFRTYQPYLPMSFLQYTRSIAACLMPVPRSSVPFLMHFQDVLEKVYDDLSFFMF